MQTQAQAKSEALRAPARVMFELAPEVLEELARGLPAAGVAAIDLQHCVEFDSSLIGVLLDLSRRAQASGASLRLLNPSANLRKLAKLYGVEELLFVDRD